MKWIGDFRGKKWFLSNMYPCEFVINGVKFKSVEHYFQYSKIKNEDVKRSILSIESPAMTKILSSRNKRVDNWEEIKLEVMYTGLKAKFSQNLDLKRLLLETEDELLEEGNTWNDRYWGVDYYSRVGENHLGKLLMRVREELKDHETNPNKLKYM